MGKFVVAYLGAFVAIFAALCVLDKEGYSQGRVR